MKKPGGKTPRGGKGRKASTSKRPRKVVGSVENSNFHLETESPNAEEGCEFGDPTEKSRTSEETVTEEKAGKFRAIAKNSDFKRRPVKNLKQILAAERAAAAASGGAAVYRSYASIDVQLPKKPVKKYSDISGFEAKYIDPHTKLRYSSIAEYATIQRLTPDIVTGYLTLRRAAVIL